MIKDHRLYMVLLSQVDADTAVVIRYILKYS